MSDVILDHPLDKVDPMLLNSEDSPVSSRYHTLPVSFPNDGDDNTSRKSDSPSAFLAEDENDQLAQTFVNRQLDSTMESYPVLTSGTSPTASRKVTPKTTGSKPTEQELLSPVGLMTTSSDNFTKQQGPLKNRRNKERKSTRLGAEDATKTKRPKMVDENRKP
jgi:hypothetical protein